MEPQFQIHNCHTHIFTIDYIPRYFISNYLPTTLAQKKWVAKVGTLLFKKTINRYGAFFYSALMKTQEDVLRELRGYYPRNTKFSVLSVDFDFMNAGKPKYGFIEQIEDLAKVAAKVNKEEKENLIIPFLGVDPRREGIYDLMREYVEEKGFRGLKLYPALGFFPNDKRLYKIYEYAEKNELPITAHCILCECL